MLCVSLPALPQDNAAEEQVLTRMDKSAATFRSAQATLDVEIFISAVNITDKQSGKIYFRRKGNDTEMALQMTDPPKDVILSGGKLQLYEPAPIDQVTVYEVSKHQDEYESLLKLGFGGGGHALKDSFEVKYLGTEKIGGVDAAKLDLTPKNPKVANLIPHVILWVDPTRGVAVQQQLFEQGGEDYRLSKYSHIVLDQKIPDSVFKLKTDSKTTIRDM